jgi:hypothetical protein
MDAMALALADGFGRVTDCEDARLPIAEPEMSVRVAALIIA